MNKEKKPKELNGKKTQCDNCRLRLLVYGNALYIYET